MAPSFTRRLSSFARSLEYYVSVPEFCSYRRVLLIGSQVLLVAPSLTRRLRLLVYQGTLAIGIVSEFCPSLLF